MEIQIVARSEEAVKSQLRLMEYNKRYIKDAADLCYRAEDESGTTVGGIVAWRGDTLLFVDLLWVDEAFRGQGLGTKLLAAVEMQGRRQGARLAEVSTFGFQAPGFYEKRGYRRFAALEPALGAWGHYFYVKEL